MEQENIVGSRRIRLHECSKIHSHGGASDKSALSLEKEQLLSSSGSVPLNPSLAKFHVSTRDVKRSSASAKESVRLNSSSGAESSKVSKGRLKAPSSLKVIMNSIFGYSKIVCYIP